MAWTIWSPWSPAGSPREVLYTSDSGFGQEEVTDADGTLNVFGRPLSAAPPSPLKVFHKTSENRAPPALAALPWFPLLRDALGRRTTGSSSSGIGGVDRWARSWPTCSSAIWR